MLWARTLLVVLLQISRITTVSVPCSSSSETTSGSWPNIPFDCFDQLLSEFQFTHVGSDLMAVEIQQSERLLGRFRYFIEKADPHFSKLPVIMLSEQMELEWRPDPYARGLGFSSYTSRGSRIFWYLERRFGFREAKARWTATYGQPGTFTLQRRTPVVAWPSMPFRAIHEPPLGILDFEKIGAILIAHQDRPEIETLLEETFSRALFRRGDYAHSSVISPSRKYIYTVTLTEYFSQDSIARSMIWYAHQTFTLVQWRFGFRTAMAVLRDSGGKVVCTLELRTPHSLGVGILELVNSTSTIRS